jgi:hypothetical protein
MAKKNDMSRLAAPGLPIPEPLRGSERGSFAEKTLSVRMPNIARKVLEDDDWSPEVVANLRELIDSMPHGVIRSLQDKSAPDAEDWERYLAPYLDQTWLQIPWFFAESYFFRRILEATGYFIPGAYQGIDPYSTLKRQGMTAAPEGLHLLCSQLDGMRAVSRTSWEQAQNTFTHLLHMAIWGNQSDLSMWWSPEQEQPGRPEANSQEEHLLDDDADKASQYLFSQIEKPVRVDFILDNGGLELGYDLALVDLLMSSGLVDTIWFHAKPYPTYVSDVTIQDVLETVDFLGGQEDFCVQDLAHRVTDYLSRKTLRMSHSYFWTSPLSGWEMPPVLLGELSHSNLIVSKGDANYRRWLGDRHWPFTTPKEQVPAYLPAPLVALRVLKSEVIVGLRPGKPEKMYQTDPQWLFDGRYGVIQFFI